MLSKNLIYCFATKVTTIPVKILQPFRTWKHKQCLLSNKKAINSFYLVTFFTNNYKSATQMPHCNGKLKWVGNRVQMSIESIDTTTKLSLLANTNMLLFLIKSDQLLLSSDVFTNNYKSAMQMPHCGGNWVKNSTELFIETIHIMPCSGLINKFNPLLCCKDY